MVLVRHVQAVDGLIDIARSDLRTICWPAARELTDYTLHPGLNHVELE